jgi:hypothetical protein
MTKSQYVEHLIKKDREDKKWVIYASVGVL